MSSGRRPHGRDEVRKAVLQASNELFGQKGPDAVSIRDVAKRANINHALVRRHFGSKQELVQEVMRNHADKFASEVSSSKDATDALHHIFDLQVATPALGRIIAHLLLSDHDPKEFVTGEGALAKLRDIFEQRDDCSLEQARVLAASTIAFTLGWLVFEPFVLAGVAFEGRVEDARAEVRQMIGDLLVDSH
jgi:AcrR family transcriptional regulator